MLAICTVPFTLSYVSILNNLLTWTRIISPLSSAGCREFYRFGEILLDFQKFYSTENVSCHSNITQVYQFNILTLADKLRVYRTKVIYKKEFTNESKM